MDRYCMNKNAQANGDHEVHKSGCSSSPEPQNQQDLGFFSNCHDAVREAKIYNPQADGCKHCSPACHTS